jgi:Glycosyl hydrolases family 39
MKIRTWGCSTVAVVLLAAPAGAQIEIKSAAPAPRITAMTESPPLVAIDWNDAIATSKLNATTQSGNVAQGPMHDKIYRALRDFNSQYPRWQMWGGGAKDPTLGVAEKQPPKDGVSGWDFSQIDPSFTEFVKAVEGHPFVVNLEMTPEWMYAPVASVADDPRGPLARVFAKRRMTATPEQFGEYYARALSWWEKGGLTDEFGKWHESGHHFKIPYWEVLNERNMAGVTPAEYTVLYDATVEAVRKVDPDIKFVGLSIAHAWEYPEYLTYFLDPKNHKPGIPLDVISYHFYAKYGPSDPAPVQVSTAFDQATAFINTAKAINAIRDKLSPPTRTMVNEIGTIIGTEAPQVPWPADRLGDIPFHLRISAAMYAYLYGNLAPLGVEAAGQSSMGAGNGKGKVGAYSACSMLNAETGTPNVRYKVAKLLMAEFPPGSKIAHSYTGIGIWRNPFPVYVQAFIAPDGKHKVLIVNKRDVPNGAVIPGAKGGHIRYLGTDLDVDSQYKDRAADADQITLSGLEVAILTMPGG